MRQPDTPSTSDAKSLAIKALAFLAGDPERLGRFLAITGLGPETIRKAATNPGFLVAVLDYLASDETLLVAFAANAGILPEKVAQAQAFMQSRAAADQGASD